MTALSAKVALAALIAITAIGGCELWRWWQTRGLRRRPARTCVTCDTLIESGTFPAIRTLCAACRRHPLAPRPRRA